jgi:hypothetical protein
MFIESQNDCRLRIADCGLNESNPKSEIRNPKSKRSALSLTEVLIAMGILTLGLLGVASVFPVGSYYMQKAEVSDKSSAIAQSVFSDLMARGMLNPRAWYVSIPNGKTTTLGQWNTTFPSDGKYSPTGLPQSGTFTRPFAAALAEALNQPTAATDKTVLAKQFGSAFVIDPIGVSLMAYRNGGSPPTSTAWIHGPAVLFPGTAYLEVGWYINPAKGGAAWAPWTGGSPMVWPVRRVTFRQPSNGWQMDPTVAEHFFRGNDDLTVDFPARDDRPGVQNWDTGTSLAGATVPLARKWTGDYSWIATVAPPSNAARDGMAANPEGFAYDVSVVVFYKRGLPDSADSTYPLNTDQTKYQSLMGASERAVQASVVSTGLNGGELLLSDWGDVKDSNGKAVSAFDQLKNGQWIMLCGPHPNSNAYLDSTTNTWKGEPRFALNWYQVVAIDQPQSGMTAYNSAKDQRIVTVRGPEWAWQPSTSLTNVSNDLCVAICKGAVAVHTKSIRLEGGISDATFSNAAGTGPAGTTQFPWQP